MMEHYYEIGGQTICLQARDNVLELKGGMLERFTTAPCREDVRISIQLCDEFPLPIGRCLFSGTERQVFAQDGAFVTYIGQSPEKAYLRMERRGKATDVLAKRSAFAGPIRTKTVLTVMEVEHLVVENGGILLHSSFISHDNCAIIFTAPSGTGKSTQAALWESLRGARIINGDRSVVRLGENGVEALGVPFSGSSGICHADRLPVAAIVYLSQAPRTTIRRLRGVQAFRAIWEGCSLHTWNNRDVDRCTQTVADLVARVPVYQLACTPDESAVIALEGVLKL